VGRDSIPQADFQSAAVSEQERYGGNRPTLSWQQKCPPHAPTRRYSISCRPEHRQISPIRRVPGAYAH